MASLVVPGVAFMIASSPQTFKLMRSVLGNWVSSAEGVATFPGLFLHTLFFLLVLYLVGRYLPKVSFMAPGISCGSGEKQCNIHTTGCVSACSGGCCRAG